MDERRAVLRLIPLGRFMPQLAGQLRVGRGLWPPFRRHLRRLRDSEEVRPRLSRLSEAR